MATFTIPSYNTIQNDALTIFKALNAAYGRSIDLSDNTEPVLRFATNSQIIALLYNFVIQNINSKLVFSATGSDLDTVANSFGLQRRGATFAQGAFTLAAMPNVGIPISSGAILTGPGGLQYTVNTSGTYENGQTVFVTAVTGGVAGNLAVGGILSWSTQPPNTQQNVSVVIPITGGNDQEDDDTLRARLYLNLQAPPGSGNTNQTAQLAGSIDTLVKQGFVYNNFAGAGTQLIALVGYQTSAYIGRDMPHFASDNYVNYYGTTIIQPGLVADAITGKPYNSYSNNSGPNLGADASIILGQIAGPVANPFATVITTVNNVPSNCIVSLTIPYPIGAQQNGSGGGWQDFAPWPVPDGYAVTGACSVVSVQGTGTVVAGATGYGITINAPSAPSTSPAGTPGASLPLIYNGHIPIAGQTHLVWVNRSDASQQGWLAVSATVLGATDDGYNHWSLVLDTPLVFAPGSSDFYGNTTGVVAGDYIFPVCANAQTYLDNILFAYGSLGPGEITTATGYQLLKQSRFPGIDSVAASALGSATEKLLETDNAEVFQASLPANAANTCLVVPAQNAPPNILVPKNIAFYPSETYLFDPTGT